MASLKCISSILLAVVAPSTPVIANQNTSQLRAPRNQLRPPASSSTTSAASGQNKRRLQSDSICSCSPTSFFFTLALTNDCAVNDLQDLPGIASTDCTIVHEDEIVQGLAEDEIGWFGLFDEEEESDVDDTPLLPLPDEVPTEDGRLFSKNKPNKHKKPGNEKRSKRPRYLQETYDKSARRITSIQFLELDATGEIINLDASNDELFPPDGLDGFTFEVESITSQLNPNVPIDDQLDLVPETAVLFMIGENEAGDEIRGRFVWRYENSCEGNEIFDGEVYEYAWAIFTDYDMADTAFCPRDNGTMFPTYVPTTFPTGFSSFVSSSIPTSISPPTSSSIPTFAPTSDSTVVVTDLTRPPTPPPDASSSTPTVVITDPFTPQPTMPGQSVFPTSNSSAGPTPSSPSTPSPVVSGLIPTSFPTPITSSMPTALSTDTTDVPVTTDAPTPGTTSKPVSGGYQDDDGYGHNVGYGPDTIGMADDISWHGAGFYENNLHHEYHGLASKSGKTGRGSKAGKGVVVVSSKAGKGGKSGKGHHGKTGKGATSSQTYHDNDDHSDDAEYSRDDNYDYDDNFAWYGGSEGMVRRR